MPARLSGAPVRLTPRQHDAVLLASRGLRHAEVATCLGVSARQVARLLAQARGVNRCATTAELIARAIAAGILPPQSKHGSFVDVPLTDTHVYASLKTMVTRV
jgi:DNA-binding CsgD family transcriptional regulator